MNAKPAADTAENANHPERKNRRWSKPLTAGRKRAADTKPARPRRSPTDWQPRCALGSAYRRRNGLEARTGEGFAAKRGDGAPKQSGFRTNERATR